MKKIIEKINEKISTIKRNNQNKEMFKIFFEAVNYCDPFILESYLEQKKGDINCKHDDGSTPLHYAVRFGRVDMARALLKAGADLNCQNIKGETPVYLAKLFQKFNCHGLENDQAYDQLVELFEETERKAEIYQSILELRKNARILNQGFSDENNILSKLPAELLMLIKGGRGAKLSLRHI